MLPFIDLTSQRTRIHDEIQAAWHRLLSHGCYINGPEIKEAERAISHFCEQSDCALVSSGSDALSLALSAIGVGAGDKVIVPDFTFIAPVQAVCALGAEPILVDIHPDTYTLDVARLEALANNKSLTGVKAVIAVDLYGCPAPYDALNTFCTRYGYALIADAAQSFGAKRDDVAVGGLADMTTLSFYPAKPLGVYGDGGGVLSRDEKLLERVKLLREHGAAASDRYRHECIGANARMDSLQAGILLAKLTIFEAELQERQVAAQRYHRLLGNLPFIKAPIVPSNCTSSWAQYTIRVPAAFRKKITMGLAEKGIPTAIHYPLAVHQQPAYSKWQRLDSGEESARAAQEVLSLPMHAYLDEETQHRIVDSLKDVLHSVVSKA